jgi:XXXCH domain-containing protein
MKTEEKIKGKYTAAQLSALLKAVGNQVAGGSVPPEDRWAGLLQDFKEISLSVKRKNSAFAVKLKVEKDATAAPREATAETAPAPTPETKTMVKYKELKKRMKSSFKAIRASLEAGALPDQALVAEFLADSEKMTTYPGKGDEYYPDYRRACARFAEAFERSDLEALGQTFGDLKTLRNECHDRYQ